MTLIWLLSFSIAMAVVSGIMVVRTFFQLRVLKAVQASHPSLALAVNSTIRERVLSQMRSRDTRFTIMCELIGYSEADVLNLFMKVWLQLIVGGFVALLGIFYLFHISYISFVPIATIVLIALFPLSRLWVTRDVARNAAKARELASTSMPNLLTFLLLYVGAGSSPTQALNDLRSTFSAVISPGGLADLDEWISDASKADTNIGVVLQEFGAKHGIDKLAQTGRYIESAITDGKPLGETLQAMISDLYIHAQQDTIMVIQARSRSANLAFMPGVLVLTAVFTIGLIAQAGGLSTFTHLFG